MNYTQRGVLEVQRRVYERLKLLRYREECAT